MRNGPNSYIGFISCHIKTARTPEEICNCTAKIFPVTPATFECVVHFNREVRKPMTRKWKPFIMAALSLAVSQAALGQATILEIDIDNICLLYTSDAADE